MYTYQSEKSRLHLFAKPSFLTGVARLIDVFGKMNTYNTSATEEQADYNALYSDWLAVGDAMTAGIEEYKINLERPLYSDR
ncbi:MAG: hypothetical protein ACPG7F_11100 [Aggregatilineales bacterium]